MREGERVRVSQGERQGEAGLRLTYGVKEVDAMNEAEGESERRRGDSVREEE